MHALAAISDRNGNRIELVEDEAETLVEVRHSGGYRIAVESDDEGRVRPSRWSLSTRRPRGPRRRVHSTRPCFQAAIGKGAAAQKWAVGWRGTEEQLAKLLKRNV